MKNSRLRRALSVFLSAAMLLMCMPFAGITASAADDIPLNDTYAYIQPQRGTFPDGETEAKEVMITNGKLPTGTLANNIPTREGYIFGGWYVWSASDDKDVPVDDDYTFTDNNLLSGISVNIDAYWYTDCTEITASNFGEVYVGYKPIDVTQRISSDSYDIPHFYLDENQLREAKLTAADWYCVDKGGSLDLSAAANCSDDVVSDSKDYYLVCTVSLENTAYRFSAKPAVAAEYGSTDYTVHSWDDKTVKISWKVPSYEVITEISDISISPDVTSSSFTLEPGEAPTGFTGTAKYTTKSGKTGTINCVTGAWLNEEGRSVYAIEEGKKYIPMVAFELPGPYYVPASTDYIDVEGMTDISTDTESYSCNIEESYECIVLTAEAITASSASSVLDNPIEYLGDVTLTPVSGDTTGTKFEFGNIPRIPLDDFEAGYKYIYVVLTSDESADAVEFYNQVKNGQIKVNNTNYAIPISFAADLPPAQTTQITVEQNAAVFIAKVNTNYVTDRNYYYTFAVKVFAAEPTVPAENKAAKASEDIGKALDSLTLTNGTTKADIQKIADDNKGDTTATVTTFELTPATVEKEGTLKVVVTISDGTNTETVTKTYTIDKLPAPSDSGDIIVDTDNNVGGAGADPAELKAAIEITAAEQALIDSGENMYIVLNVERADSTVSTADETLTESVKDNMTIGIYLDISLIKKIGELEFAVTETAIPVTISFTMPAELINTNSSVTRTYKIIRVHNGVPDVLDCVFDPATGKASFMTNKFSSYAIAYVDVPVSEPQTPVTKYPLDLGTDGRIHSSASSAAAGDVINIAVDPGYIAHVFSGNTEIARISGAGTFVMPANGVKIVVECELGQYMLTKARSYVYSYDSSMNFITVNATKNQKSSVTINLGKEYAGKSFVIYEGKKSTSVKVTEGTLDKNGKFTLEIDYGKNYTLVVED